MRLQRLSGPRGFQNAAVLLATTQFAAATPRFGISQSKLTTRTYDVHPFVKRMKRLRLYGIAEAANPDRERYKDRIKNRVADV